MPQLPQIGTLEGLDFTKPGAAEAYYAEHQGFYDQPTLSQMFAEQQLNDPRATSRYAEEAYKNFAGSSPANMDPYYENARRKATEQINQTMAARGTYGSSAANDLIREAYENLAADQANREAQYGLQRGGLMGQLGGAADASLRSNLGTLGGLAGQGDAAALARIQGGMGAAQTAQGAQRTRGQDAFMNQLTYGNALSDILGQDMGMIGNYDQATLDKIINLNTGAATEGANQARMTADRTHQNVADFGGAVKDAIKIKQAYDQLQQPPQQQNLYSGPTAPTYPGAYGY
jgi:hypothetical protein